MLKQLIYGLFVFKILFYFTSLIAKIEDNTIVNGFIELIGVDIVAKVLA